jgi:hypothetical protein
MQDLAMEVRGELTKALVNSTGAQPVISTCLPLAARVDIPLYNCYHII